MSASETLLRDARRIERDNYLRFWQAHEEERRRCDEAREQLEFEVIQSQENEELIKRLKDRAHTYEAENSDFDCGASISEYITQPGAKALITDADNWDSDGKRFSDGQHYRPRRHRHGRRHHRRRSTLIRATDGSRSSLDIRRCRQRRVRDGRSGFASCAFLGSVFSGLALVALFAYRHVSCTGRFGGGGGGGGGGSDRSADAAADDDDDIASLHSQPLGLSPPIRPPPPCS